MIGLNITLPDGFLEDEVRDGHLVTRGMKEVWAVELDLLSEAMRVLNKYSLKYYAIGGTLLGAIRHYGYIPWDDDIDIAMPRKDYEEFRKIARNEFRHPYFFQDEFNSPGLLCGHAKLRNSETTMVHSNHLNEKVGELSFNMGIFIDFFPVDNLPDDETERNEWIAQIRDVAQKAWHLRLFTHRGRNINNKKIKYKLQEFLFNAIWSPNFLFKKYNKILSRYSNTDTEYACLYCVYCRNDKEKSRWVWNNKDLGDNHLVYYPFEFLKLPCPANYDAVLKKSYGNWREKIKAKSQHGYASESFYDVNNPYTQYFNQKGVLDRKLVRKLLDK